MEKVDSNKFTSIEEQLRESQAFLHISQMLAHSLDLPTILRQIVDVSVTLIPNAEQSVIHLVDESQSLLRPVAVARPSANQDHTPLYFRSGEGIAGIVIKHGKTINVKDTIQDHRFVLQDRSIQIYRSLLVAPIQLNQRTIGTLSVESRLTGAFSEYSTRILTNLGEQAALAIGRAQILQEEQDQRQLAEALREASNIQGSGIDLKTVFEQMLRLVKKVIPYDTASIMMIENGQTRMTQQAGFEKFGKAVVRQAAEFSYDINRNEKLKLMLDNGKPVIIGDTHHESNWESELPMARTWAGAPILSQGQVIAFLSLSKLEPGFYQPSHADRLLAFVNQASLTVEKAILYDDLQSTLAKEQAARSQLVQSEKLAALGRIVASVAHELNNPLQAIQNALYLINLEENLTNQAQDDLKVAINEANRMAGLIARLRETYRPTSREEFQPCSVNEIVNDVEKLISTHLKQNNISIVFQPGDNIPLIPLIKDQIKQVLLNISLNAVESMESGGSLTIKTRYDPNQKSVCLGISDTGSGIDPEVLPYIFDPFVTTKDGGTGLGLAITYDIISRHGGRIEPDSHLGSGTTFNIWLPTEIPSE